MLRLRTILFPTDHTACAEHAFAHAATLADLFEADIHVLHVSEGAPGGEADLEEIHLSELAVARDLHLVTTKPFQEARARGRVPRLVRAEVAAASVAPAIAAYARDHEADLIVMGTHGRRGLSRLFSGSIAEDVVRRAACPVLTVRADAPVERGTAERVLVPIDGSPWADVQIRYAADLAARYGAALDVLHVVDDEAFSLVYGTEAVAPPAAGVVASAQEAAEAMVAAAGAEADVHIVVGSPVLQIQRFAETHGADLIVMGTHGRKGLAHLVLGSVAEAVLRAAPCPVLTLSRQASGLASEATSEEASEGASAADAGAA